MFFANNPAKTLLTLVALLFALMPGAPLAADLSSRQSAQDPEKRRTARIENFLLRACEELDKSLGYEKAAIEGLERQLGSTNTRELLDWYRNYANWLRERLSESESDLENFYSRGMIRPGLADRYYAMAEDYARLAEQLTLRARQIDEAKGINETTIQKLNKIIEYYEYVKEQTEKMKTPEEKLKLDRKAPDDWILYYKNLNDDEIKRMKAEIIGREDLRQQFDVLIELGRHELNWLSLKADDSAALSGLAGVLITDSLDRVEIACNSMIRQYEADISFLQKNVKEMDGKRAGTARAGTMRSLDRMDRLWDYYVSMKNRFEHHIQWLKEQIGAYRADIVLLAKEKRE